jgi:hypothetical protein
MTVIPHAHQSNYNFCIFLIGLPAITVDLNAPPIATTLTAALFVLAMGIAPVFWASASDYYQVRRVLLVVSMLIFAAASLGSAFINNIWGLVVLRCVQSVGSSCGSSVGAGMFIYCFLQLISFISFLGYSQISLSRSFFLKGVIAVSYFSYDLILLAL